MALTPVDGRSAIVAAVECIAEALDSVADVNPVFLRPDEQARALVELSALEARMAELKLRVLADAEQVADETGARDVGCWLAHATRQRPEDGRRALRLARALDRRPVLAEAMRDGSVHEDQAHVIATALDQLPDEIPAEVVTRAERHLVALAGEHNPQQLHRLSRRIVELVAPEIFEAREARALALLEADAHSRATLTMRSRGDGTTRIVGLVPDAVAGRLARYLHAFANPRREAPAAGDPLTRLPIGRKAAEALATFLEAVDPTRLPVHGGDATTVVVTVTLEDLRSELATATIDTHLSGDSLDTITADEARRLACNATIIPVVLGGRSEVLDLGRARRLFSRAQHRALATRQRTCAARGCTIPSTWSEAHHLQPWSRGGVTSLANAVLLCSHHHHLVHDPRVGFERHADGSIRFHRRR